jgi:hypothetical protein
VIRIGKSEKNPEFSICQKLTADSLIPKMAGPDSPLSKVTPLFIKNSDFGNRMTEFGVCSLIAENINDPSELIGCQRIGGLWRIYFKTDNSSLNDLKYNGRAIPIYKQNPF